MINSREEDHNRSRLILLDGGMGHELKLRLGTTLSELNVGYTAFGGGADVNSTHRADTVVALHREYLRAGCDVITTNNFISTERNLGNAASVKHEIHSAIRVARKAIDEEDLPISKRDVQIAGSIPPLNEWCVSKYNNFEIQSLKFLFS